MNCFPPKNCLLCSDDLVIYGKGLKLCKTCNIDYSLFRNNKEIFCHFLFQKYEVHYNMTNDVEPIITIGSSDLSQPRFVKNKPSSLEEFKKILTDLNFLETLIVFS